MNTEMRKRVAALAMAAFLALPAAALAQGMPGHHRTPTDSARAHMAGGQAMMGAGLMNGMMGQSMMGGMGTMMGSTPGFILAQKDALGLTAEQTDRIQSLQQQAAQAWQTHMAGMQGLREQMGQLSGSEKPDLDRYQKVMQQMASSGIAMRVQIARLGQEAEKVLTPDQRSKLSYGRQLMGRGGMYGMGRGAMMGGDGMPGMGRYGSGTMGSGSMGGRYGSGMMGPGYMNGHMTPGARPCGGTAADSSR